MSEELIEGSNAVEAKLAEAGADQVRRFSFDQAPEAAPETGTPAEEVSAEIPERTRDERGRFAAAEQPEVAEPEAQGEVAAETPTVDPDVAKFLAKYGGDVDKALQGAVNLQRKAGEQSNEVGELRQLVEQLSTLNNSISQAQAQPQPQYVDQGTIDWFDQQVYDNPNQAVELARQQGNSILFQRGLAAWKEIAPADYAVYVNELRNQQYFGQIQQQLQQQQQQAQLPQDAQINLALSNVLNRNPEFTTYSDVLDSTMEKYPYAAKLLNAATQSGDSAQIEGAIETLYSLARGDTLYSALRAGDTPEDSTTTAQVAVPQTSETREAPAEPTAEDEFRQAFRQEAERQTRGVWTAH